MEPSSVGSRERACSLIVMQPVGVDGPEHHVVLEYELVVESSDRGVRS
jgi:hypothetical protein